MAKKHIKEKKANEGSLLISDFNAEIVERNEKYAEFTNEGKKKHVIAVDFDGSVANNKKHKKDKNYLNPFLANDIPAREQDALLPYVHSNQGADNSCNVHPNFVILDHNFDDGDISQSNKHTNKSKKTKKSSNNFKEKYEENILITEKEKHSSVNHKKHKSKHKDKNYLNSFLANNHISGMEQDTLLSTVFDDPEVQKKKRADTGSLLTSNFNAVINEINKKSYAEFTNESSKKHLTVDDFDGSAINHKKHKRKHKKDRNYLNNNLNEHSNFVILDQSFDDDINQSCKHKNKSEKTEISSGMAQDTLLSTVFDHPEVQKKKKADTGSLLTSNFNAEINEINKKSYAEFTNEGSKKHLIVDGFDGSAVNHKKHKSKHKKDRNYLNNSLNEHSNFVILDQSFDDCDINQSCKHKNKSEKTEISSNNSKKKHKKYEEENLNTEKKKHSANTEAYALSNGHDITSDSCINETHAKNIESDSNSVEIITVFDNPEELKKYRKKKKANKGSLLTYNFNDEINEHSFAEFTNEGNKKHLMADDFDGSAVNHKKHKSKHNKDKNYLNSVLVNNDISGVEQDTLLSTVFDNPEVQKKYQKEKKANKGSLLISNFIAETNEKSYAEFKNEGNKKHLIVNDFDRSAVNHKKHKSKHKKDNYLNSFLVNNDISGLEQDTLLPYVHFNQGAKNNVNVHSDFVTLDNALVDNQSNKDRNKSEKTKKSSNKSNKKHKKYEENNLNTGKKKHFANTEAYTLSNEHDVMSNHSVNETQAKNKESDSNSVEICTVFDNPEVQKKCKKKKKANKDSSLTSNFNAEIDEIHAKSYAEFTNEGNKRRLIADDFDGSAVNHKKHKKKHKKGKNSVLANNDICGLEQDILLPYVHSNQGADNNLNVHSDFVLLDNALGDKHRKKSEKAKKSSNNSEKKHEKDKENNLNTAEETEHFNSLKLNFSRKQCIDVLKTQSLSDDLSAFDFTDNAGNCTEIASTIDYTDEQLENIVENVKEYSVEIGNRPVPCNLDCNEDPVDFEVPPLHKFETLRLTQKQKTHFIASNVFIKSGKFTIAEDKIIQRNFEDFAKKYHTSDVFSLLGIGKYEKNRELLKFLKAKHFYVRLAKDLNDRSLNSIYKRARKILHPYRDARSLTQKEIECLKKQYLSVGKKWQHIADTLGCSAGKCVETFRWHEKDIAKGHFTDEEKTQLIEAIKKVSGSSDLSCKSMKGVSWETIASYVPSRNGTQCRMYWANYLAWAPGSAREKWNKKCFCRLVHILKELNVKNSSMIDWYKVHESFEDFAPSVLYLQKRWLYLISQIPDYKKKSHEDIVNLLCIKYPITR